MQLCAVILLVLAWHGYTVLAFSDGTKLATGTTATRRIYCHRSAATRKPLHFDSECGGFCQPRMDTAQFYTLNVSASSYWLSAVRVNISAKPGSGKSVTGFSVYALDEHGGTAGSFMEDDHDVTVGTCANVIMYSDETPAAFHKKADRSRENVSIEWQPDGFNHGPVKFVMWIVHNHSEVYYMESEPLPCQRNGSYTLDLENTLHDIISAIDLELFEKTFSYRSKLGYNLDDPWAPFSNPPSELEFVPVELAKPDDAKLNKLLSVTAKSGSGMMKDGDKTNDTEDQDDDVSGLDANDTMSSQLGSDDRSNDTSDADNMVDDGNDRNKNDDSADDKHKLLNGKANADADDDEDDRVMDIMNVNDNGVTTGDFGSMLPTAAWGDLSNDSITVSNNASTGSGDNNQTNFTGESFGLLGVFGASDGINDSSTTTSTTGTTTTTSTTSGTTPDASTIASSSDATVTTTGDDSDSTTDTAIPGGTEESSFIFPIF